MFTEDLDSCCIFFRSNFHGPRVVLTVRTISHQCVPVRLFLEFKICAELQDLRSDDGTTRYLYNFVFHVTVNWSDVWCSGVICEDDSTAHDGHEVTTHIMRIEKKKIK
jgi:hypothetical protein